MGISESLAHVDTTKSRQTLDHLLAEQQETNRLLRVVALRLGAAPEDVDQAPPAAEKRTPWYQR